jgi:hypothetical protein
MPLTSWVLSSKLIVIELGSGPQATNSDDSTPMAITARTIRMLTLSSDLHYTNAGS